MRRRYKKVEEERFLRVIAKPCTVYVKKTPHFEQHRYVHNRICVASVSYYGTGRKFYFILEEDSVPRTPQTTNNMKTLEEKAKDAGYETGRYEGDLHIKAEPYDKVFSLIEAHYKTINLPVKSLVSTFRNQIDGSLWFECPFQHLPPMATATR